LMLARANQDDDITRQLQVLLKQIKPVDSSDSLLHRYRASALRGYRHFWRLRGSNQLIGFIFILQAIVFVVVIFATLATNVAALDKFRHGHQVYGTSLLIGQLASSLVAGAFAVIGALQLPRSRVNGFEWFRRATLITIFLTEFFIFTRIQFGAMPGFIINLLLFASLNFALSQERRNY
jgi:hypothetical protein